MEEEILEFIKTSNISPWCSNSENAEDKNHPLARTRYVQAIWTRVRNYLSRQFTLAGTSQIWNIFIENIKTDGMLRKQEFFKNIHKVPSFSLMQPHPTWKPSISMAIITESGSTYQDLKKHNLPVILISSPQELSTLEEYDLVYAVDCEECALALDQLPNVVNATHAEVALEKNLRVLSGWTYNIRQLQQESDYLSIHEPRINKIVAQLENISKLLECKITSIDRNRIEQQVDVINKQLTEQLQQTTLAGPELIRMLQENILPASVQQTIQKALQQTTLPAYLFEIGYPVKVNESEVANYLRDQQGNQSVQWAQKIKKHKEEIEQVPALLDELSAFLLLLDFKRGTHQHITSTQKYPRTGSQLRIKDVKNIFLDDPQPISFSLTGEVKGSVLTGANSGGKTTLLEHTIQVILLAYTGLPVEGEVEIPQLSNIYYFAKTKGTASKGAFETLLTQLSKINPEEGTLILADEIEAVTEPGVAGKIICATLDYFLSKGCMMIIATHLGEHIQSYLPRGTRIDGIEAKGLSDTFELIVDHNPVQGKLAQSTPQLIVRKMAHTQKSEFIEHLADKIQ